MTKRSPPDDASNPARGALPSDAVQSILKIVAIGASAGGLEAVRRLLAALPPETGMAYILVQHLDPTHPSMLVDLIAKDSPLAVVEASDGMMLQADRLHILPPGADMAVADGVMQVAPSQVQRGHRMPFDHLLKALALDPHAVVAVVVLSGGGSDGSEGIRAIYREGNLVLAQDPNEAGQPGMPQSAIATGFVDRTLPAAEIAAELARFAAAGQPPNGLPRVLPTHGKVDRPDWLDSIIDFLRAGHGHDFRNYKPGTLVRRIERRAGMAGFTSSDIHGYLASLRDDAAEAALLVNDMLINVTSFFRDEGVFKFLADTVVPDIVARHNGERPLRIWSAACSTGEETYSLAMLFIDEIARNRPELKLQMFASDVDVKAVAAARAGYYPAGIASEVSADRLQRFFTRNDNGWQVNSEVRSCIVFAIQDILVDPPFSQLDIVSCRNFLIYLDAEAQSKAIAQFQFALLPEGRLLLGKAESIGESTAGFEVVSKTYRVYRRLGNTRSPVRPSARNGVTAVGALTRDTGPSRFGLTQGFDDGSDLARLCQDLLIRKHLPAAVLVNRALECIHSIGKAHKYLRMVPNAPSLQIMAMLPQPQRNQFRAAVRKAALDTSITIPARPGLGEDGFGMIIHRLDWKGEPHFLVCFTDSQPNIALHSETGSFEIVALEEELADASQQLDLALQRIDRAAVDEITIRAEALAHNEEYQTANEELLTSQEELQSLNEELTALNVQLQESLDGQRTTSDDLKNILYSTDVATIFLDTNLNIRFFTPATRLLFRMLPGDIGRPLADLASIAIDATLDDEARVVLAKEIPVEREIEAGGGVWFLRRVIPYRAHDNRVGGVVITFVDITERKRAASVLVEARRQADAANLAKSRFLAAASHDLRQPLQALVLLHEMMAQKAPGADMEGLLLRLDRTLGAMSGMLNTLLDINQIEAGSVHAKIEPFSVEITRTDLVPPTDLDNPASGIGVDILLIDDDAEQLDLVSLLLQGAGHRTAIAMDEAAALAVLQRKMPRPAMIISDFNLADGKSGLQLAEKLRQRLGWHVPVIILTGDISIDALSRIPDAACVQLSKPVRMSKLLETIDGLLFPVRQALAGDGGQAATEIVYLIDDDPKILQMFTVLLGAAGFVVRGFTSGEAFLEHWQPDRAACLVVDAVLPGISGLELVRDLKAAGRLPPTIIITGRGDIDLAVSAMKLGVLDFIEKPVDGATILTLIRKAYAESRDNRADEVQRQRAAATLKTLTKREKQVLKMVLDGHPSKNIAADLQISQRTVEKYRSEIMSKTGTTSLPALARLVLAPGAFAAIEDSDD